MIITIFNITVIQLSASVNLTLVPYFHLILFVFQGHQLTQYVL